MEKRKDLLGEDHPDTLTSMGNLAAIYMNQGQWKEAEALEVVVMEKRKHILGQEHPDTLKHGKSCSHIQEPGPMEEGRGIGGGDNG